MWVPRVGAVRDEQLSMISFLVEGRAVCSRPTGNFLFWWVGATCNGNKNKHDPINVTETKTPNERGISHPGRQHGRNLRKGVLLEPADRA